MNSSMLNSSSGKNGQTQNRNSDSLDSDKAVKNHSVPLFRSPSNDSLTQRKQENNGQSPFKSGGSSASSPHLTSPIRREYVLDLDVQKFNRLPGAHGDDKWSVWMCVQCSEVYDNADRVPSKLRCGHIICGSCLLILIEKAPRCPICQKTFAKTEVAAGPKVTNNVLVSSTKNLPNKVQVQGNREERLHENLTGRDIRISPTNENTSNSPTDLDTLRNRYGNIWVCVQCVETYVTFLQGPLELRCGHTLCKTCDRYLGEKVHRCRICLLRQPNDSSVEPPKNNSQYLAAKNQFPDDSEENCQGNKDKSVDKMTSNSKQSFDETMKGNLTNTAQTEDASHLNTDRCSMLCGRCTLCYGADHCWRKMSCGHTLCRPCHIVTGDSAPECQLCSNYSVNEGSKDAKVSAPAVEIKITSESEEISPENNKVMKGTVASNIIKSLVTENDSAASHRQEIVRLKPAATDVQQMHHSRVWVCVKCSSMYKTADQSPKILSCEHKLCNSCMKNLGNEAPSCLICIRKDVLTEDIKANHKDSSVRSKTPPDAKENFQENWRDSKNPVALIKKPLVTERVRMKTPPDSRAEKQYTTENRKTGTSPLSEVGKPFRSENLRRRSFTEKMYSGNSAAPDNLMDSRRSSKDFSQSNEGKGTSSLKSHARKPSGSENVRRRSLTEGIFTENSAATDSFYEEYRSKAMKCPDCTHLFNDSARQPRVLHCGHTICTSCLRFIINRSSGCPTCNTPLSIKTVHDAVLNRALCDIIRNIGVKNGNKSKARDISPTNSRAEKPIVDVGSYNPKQSFSSGHNNYTSSYSSTSPKKSPHNSMCLEAGATPKSHCASCMKWVCDDCGHIDHPQHKGCYLIPKIEAVQQMKEAHVHGVTVTGETVNSSLKALQIYQDQLDAFSLTMQAAFECIGKEKGRIKMMMEEGQARLTEMQTSVSGLSTSKNLLTALAAMVNVEDLTNSAQQWVTTDSKKIVDHKMMGEMIKGILLSSVQMMQMSDGKSMGALSLLASHVVRGNTLLSRMMVDEGRVFVQCLEMMATVPKGTRALPLSSIKACLDASPLVFLDIGWNGNIVGRVTIRLMGDTFRGRQFLIMCTGEMGPSFTNTHFHRIWLKGSPGEHIWGGDYDRRDGSGGMPVLKISGVKPSLSISKSMPIKAGVVAGSFEKTSPGTLFRIYTKDQVEANSRPSLYSGDDDVVDDPAAFGMVERGLDVLKAVVKHSNITEITIYACGIVVEP